MIRLALATDRLPKELLASTDSAELEEMRVYDEIYNIPDGYYVATTLGMATYRAMTGECPEAEAFAPIFETPDVEESEIESHQKMQAFAAAHNRGKV